MSACASFKLTLREEAPLELTFSENALGFPISFDSIIDYDKYSGSYEITPSLETQTLQTAGKLMTGDVVVNPIPNNYGLITWNGSTITVS